MKEGDVVVLWRVIGIGKTYFATKIEAEAAARKEFPYEDQLRRYSRIGFLQSEPHVELC